MYWRDSTGKVKKTHYYFYTVLVLPRDGREIVIYYIIIYSSNCCVYAMPIYIHSNYAVLKCTSSVSYYWYTSTRTHILSENAYTRSVTMPIVQYATYLYLHENVLMGYCRAQGSGHVPSSPNFWRL